MLEFNQVPGDEERYLQGFGGDTSNFCIAAARQGGRVGYLTRLGRDAFGRHFLELWQRERVDTRGVGLDSEAHTGIYFVTHTAAGHVFTYFRASSAASRIRPEDLALDLIESTRYLHVSGISQAISDSACDAVFFAIEQARKAGAKISYDPNLRLKLWPLARARAIIEATIALTDYFLPSLEDARALTGLDDPERIAEYFLARGAKAIALKLGADGALLVTKNESFRIKGHTVSVVDATGAGDCFDGALIARLDAGDDFVDASLYANAAAALAITGFGAVAPIPYSDAVHSLLKTTA
ncbi:MAG TPA: sugar kinase [Chthoniobacterales bacterium]|nr:sugar kinase [Chthoniobacterales bacterium]